MLCANCAKLCKQEDEKSKHLEDEKRIKSIRAPVEVPFHCMCGALLVYGYISDSNAENGHFGYICLTCHSTVIKKEK